MTRAKRLMDLSITLPLAVLLAGPLVILLLLIWLIDGRPLLHSSERMADPNKRFRLWKLRTMTPSPDGATVCGGNLSGRITRLGRILRNTRLDEIPQLWNVILGDMTLVGPRPPLPAYVDQFPDLYARVLRNRPGLTGLASLRFHQHEERLLAGCRTAQETDMVYARHCIPRKARLDLIYQRRQSLLFDLRLLTSTALLPLSRLLQPVFRQSRDPGLKRRINTSSCRMETARNQGSASLLPREVIHPDLQAVAQTLKGKTVLVTGAGGSIGSELCRHLLDCGPARLLLLDHSEAALFGIDLELRERRVDVAMVPILGSVADRDLLRDLFRQYQVDTVVHAAAYKHVPLAEANPLAAVANNVFGTLTLAECSARARVRRFIQISTDKAVRPVGVMGATKRLAEMVVQDISRRFPTTAFSIVRFGNVLGSSGSVVPLFRAQIARGGPVMLTHRDVTRYFMTAEEAARLVLAALFSSASGSAQVYLLDMGRPIRIRNLARRMIAEVGLKVRDAACPDGDIEIRISGLRPGEKLHEELLIGEDVLPTSHPKILRARETGLSAAAMRMALDDLRLGQRANDPVLMRTTLFRWAETPSTNGPFRQSGGFHVTAGRETMPQREESTLQSGLPD